LKWFIPSASIVFRKNVLDERIKSKILIGGDRVLSLLCADKVKIMGISATDIYAVSNGVKMIAMNELTIKRSL
jgi:hypothetical protein